MRRTALLLALVLPLFATSIARADLTDIRKRGTLRVLVVDGSPAFFNLKTGRPGLEREILDGFARLQKLQVVPVEVATWEELVPALLEGRGDLIAGGVTDTAARREKIAFTTEVFPTRHVVVTRKPSPAVRTVDELRRQKKVGVIKGTSLEEAARQAGVLPASLDTTVPGDGLLAALQSGRVTAVVDGVEDALLLQRADPTLEIGVYVGPPASLAFGLPRGDAELRRALDEHLLNMRRSQGWSRLVVEYFGPLALDVLKQARAN
jgi:membrane-bound lytic murein transglycosylase F